MDSLFGADRESGKLRGNAEVVGVGSSDAKAESPTDALLRVTTSGICGSDHMYDGRTPLDKGTVVGHEIMGVIEETGEAVSSIKKGDRVVVPFNISCGFCYNKFGAEKKAA